MSSPQTSLMSECWCRVKPLVLQRVRIISPDRTHFPSPVPDNNTTPDDVGICEAYLAFLRANGDNGVYWRVLSDHGISRARLEGFDRSIRCEPGDYPHMRGTLIGTSCCQPLPVAPGSLLSCKTKPRCVLSMSGEFENYLSILKAVHSGTDLQTSAQAAAYCTPEPAKGFLGYVLSNRHGQVSRFPSALCIDALGMFQMMP